MSSEFYCKFCDITCTGKAPYEQHLQSAKHLKKSKLSESVQPIAEGSISTPQNTTTTTQIPISTLNRTVSDDSTISSASFSISPQTMRILLEWTHPADYHPYCDICQLPLYGEGNVDTHFGKDNKLHAQKLAVWKQIKEGDAPLSCKICCETFPNELLMRDHFLSTAHADMVQQKINIKKIIQIYQTYQKLKQARLQRQNEESNSTADDKLISKFQNMKVIDGTERKSNSTKSGPFDLTILEASMKKPFEEDDD